MVVGGVPHVLGAWEVVLGHKIGAEVELEVPEQGADARHLGVALGQSLEQQLGGKLGEQPQEVLGAVQVDGPCVGVLLGAAR